MVSKKKYLRKSKPKNRKSKKNVRKYKKNVRKSNIIYLGGTKITSTDIQNFKQKYIPDELKNEKINNLTFDDYDMVLYYDFYKQVKTQYMSVASDPKFKINITNVNNIDSNDLKNLFQISNEKENVGKTLDTYFNEGGGDLSYSYDFFEDINIHVLLWFLKKLYGMKEYYKNLRISPQDKQKIFNDLKKTYDENIKNAKQEYEKNKNDAQIKYNENKNDAQKKYNENMKDAQTNQSILKTQMDKAKKENNHNDYNDFVQKFNNINTLYQQYTDELNAKNEHIMNEFNIENNKILNDFNKKNKERMNHYNSEITNQNNSDKNSGIDGYYLLLFKIFISIYDKIKNNKGLDEELTTFRECLKGRFKQFSGTCWLSASMNICILCKSIKEEIIKIIKNDKNETIYNMESFDELIRAFNNKVLGNNPTNMLPIEIIQQYNNESNVTKIKEEHFKYLLIGIFYLIFIKKIYPKDEDGDIPLVLANYINLKTGKRMSEGNDFTVGVKTILNNLDVGYINYLNDIVNTDIVNTDIVNTDTKIDEIKDKKIILFQPNYKIKNDETQSQNSYNNLIKTYNLEAAGINYKYSNIKEHGYVGFKCNGEYYEYDSNNFIRKIDWTDIKNYTFDDILFYVFIKK
jgi:hypothetical protein